MGGGGRGSTRGGEGGNAWREPGVAYWDALKGVLARAGRAGTRVCVCVCVCVCDMGGALSALAGPLRRRGRGRGGEVRGADELRRASRARRGGARKERENE